MSSPDSAFTGTTSSWINSPKTAPTNPISEEACVEHGGHCFERTGIVLTSIPPQYPEVCKHCGKRRRAIAADPWNYLDD